VTGMGRNPDATRALAFCGLATFVTCVVVAHVARPSLDPLSHMVSEYARYGPRLLITAGFAAWSLSFAAATPWFLLHRPRRWSRAIASCGLAAAAGIVLIAAFRTQTSAGHLAFGSHLALGGRLHDAGSGLATLSLLAAACLSLGLNTLTVRRRIAVAALLVLCALASAVLLAIGQEVGGLRQRILLGSACAWEAVVLGSRPEDGTSGFRARPDRSAERSPA